MTAISRLAGLVLLAGLLAGCAVTAPPLPVEWQDSSLDRVWPKPPETPRVRLLRTVRGGEDIVDEEQARGRLLQWLTGEKKEFLPLLLPYGVAADGRGRIWVADAGSRAVHVFDLARNRVKYILAAGGEPLSSPVGVAYDPETRRLYVSDSALKKVFVFDDRLKLLGTREPEDGYRRPAGLAVDGAGNLHVVDVLAGRVEIFSRDGDYLRGIDGLELPEGFNRPANVAIGPEGRVYVTDSMNFRVAVFAPDGEVLGTVGQIGSVPGSFARPRGVAVDSEGHIYVADAAFDNIQIFDSAGRLLLFFGGPGKKPGEFNLPAGLFFDRDDRLYVADPYNQRIQVFQYLPASGSPQ